MKLVHIFLLKKFKKVKQIRKESGNLNNLEIFKNEEFGEIRTVTINNEPYFVGNDVAAILGYAEPRSTVSKKVDAEDKGVAKLETPSGVQEMTVINESGLYSLILGSKLESAKRFKHWVTSEVLPSIRKNGGYIANQENMSPEQIVANALVVAQNIICNQKKQIADLEHETIEMANTISEMQPKVNYVDRILQSKGTVTVTQIASDYGISAIKFNKILRDLGIQRKVHGQWILYGKYQGNGYTHSSTFDFERADGQLDSNMNTEWTQKGRLFLYEKLKENNMLPVIERKEV